jgi:hypothetical protein
MTTDGIIPPETFLCIVGLQPPETDTGDSGLSVHAQSFDFVKGSVQAKMQKLNVFLSRTTDKLLIDFAVAKFAPDKCKQSLPLK